MKLNDQIRVDLEDYRKLFYFEIKKRKRPVFVDDLMLLQSKAAAKGGTTTSYYLPECFYVFTKRISRLCLLPGSREGQLKHLNLFNVGCDAVRIT